MEKSAYNPNYPQMPAQMTSAAGANEEMKNYPAPPSYDQATGSSAAVMAPYPPVQVLPPSQVGWATNNNIQQPETHQPRPSQSSYPTHRHNPPTVIAPTQQYATYQGVPPTMQQPVVFIQQQTTLPLGPEPTYITCPACHIQKLTRIEYEPSSRTHLMAALLCILGLWCCVCLPYCAGSCMNANHYCGNCNKFLGTYGNGL